MYSEANKDILTQAVMEKIPFIILDSKSKNLNDDDMYEFLFKKLEPLALSHYKDPDEAIAVLNIILSTKIWKLYKDE